MRYLLLLVLLLFCSCNPFYEDNVLKYKDELLELTSKLESYDNVTLSRDDVSEFIIDDLRSLKIDYIIKNKDKKNRQYSGFTEGNDSLIIFIKKSRNIFDYERRIIYDFKKTPRNFGNETIDGASYTLTQLDKRWYYIEIGFD